MQKKILIGTKNYTIDEAEILSQMDNTAFLRELQIRLEHNSIYKDTIIDMLDRIAGGGDVSLTNELLTIRIEHLDQYYFCEEFVKEFNVRFNGLHPEK